MCNLLRPGVKHNVKEYKTKKIEGIYNSKDIKSIRNDLFYKKFSVCNLLRPRLIL